MNYLVKCCTLNIFNIEFGGMGWGLFLEDSSDPKLAPP